MFRVLLVVLIFGFSTLSNAIPLSSWNLNLGTLGGANGSNINTVTLNGFSELDQAITGNSAFGQSFTFGGSLQWVQYQQTGVISPLSFGLPIGYTDLYFRFSGLSGTLDNSGNATFTPGIGAATLYLDSGGSLIPGNQALPLASYGVAIASSASDIAYYDGFGINPMFNLSFQLNSAAAGLLTDNNGAPILPGAIFAINVDGLLDPSILINPTLVPGGIGTSVNTLINAGEVSAVNVAQLPPTIPEPATTALLLIGLAGLWAMRNRNIT